MKNNTLANKTNFFLFVILTTVFKPFCADAIADISTEQEAAEAAAAALEGLKRLSLKDLFLVEIATGKKQSIIRTPAVTTVITASDIEAMGATELDEVLESVPGLHVSNSNIGYNPIYTMRGIYSAYNPQVLIMINGITINRLYTGGRDPIWGGMPVNSIARIEIIRGPSSAVFGADALSGVINIITKKIKNINGTELGTRLGSFNTQDAWLLHGKNYSGFDVAINLEYHNTDGQNSIIEQDAQTYYDQLYQTEASHAPDSVNLQRRNFDMHIDVTKEYWQLQLGYQGRRNIGTGAGVSQALDPTSRHEADRFSSTLIYHNPEFSKNWDVTAQTTYLNTGYQPSNNQYVYPAGAFNNTYPQGFIGNPGLSQSDMQLDLSAFYTGFSQHVLRIGTGYHYADLYKVIESKNFGTNPYTNQPISPDTIVDVTDTPVVFLPEGARKSWYTFIQDIYTLTSDWEVTAGLRYDHYSDFGSTTNPRLALVWETTPVITSKLLYGKAFRAPAFRELYTINNPNSLGNPNLKPETIDTWELAFNYHPDTDSEQNMSQDFDDPNKEIRQLGVNIFHYNWKDAIQYAPDADDSKILVAQNVGTQKGYGFEVEASWKINNNLNLISNYSWQHAINKLDDSEVANVPKHLLYLRTDWQFLPAWYVDVQYNWVADRKRALNDPRSEVDDYSLVNLTLRRKLVAKHWDFTISVHNLFDVDAREPSIGPDSSGIVKIPNDLPLAGRNYFMEVRYHFD